MTMYNKPRRIPVTIASGETKSAAFLAAGGTIFGLQLPNAFSGTAVTFEGAAAIDDDFEAVYDSDGNQVSAAVAANRSVGLSGAEADALAPWPFVKLVSNAGGGEAADRIVIVSIR